MTDRNAQPAAAAATILMATLCGSGLPTVAAAQSTADKKPEEVIVTGSIIPTPTREIGTAVSVIDGPEIELRGYDGLADVLRTQTGIAVTNSGGPGKATALRIRGEEGYRTVLIIDGVKMVDPSGTQAAPNFDSLMATGEMQRVEILRGPQGFIYGADAGGVVNVISGRGAEGFGARVGIEAGEFATRKVSGSVSGGTDQADYYVSATDLQTDGFNAQTADIVLRDDDGADNTTLHAKVGWNVSNNLRLQLVARDTDASTMYDGCFNPTTFATVHDCVATTDQSAYRLSADQQSGDFTNSFGYSDVDNKRDNLTQGASTFATRGELSRLEYTGSYKASDATTVVYGLDLQDEDVTSGTDRLSRGQDGYYFEYQGSFGDNLFLAAGARFDDNDDFGNHTSARVSLAYTQDLAGGNSLKYRASVGTGFRAPSLYEISYNQRPFGVLAAAARQLKEETSQGYDLGVDYDGANGFHFEATYFDQDIEDAIVYMFDGTTFDDGYVQSFGTSTSKGIELGVSVPLGARLAFLGNWTNDDAKTMDGQPRVRRPKNVGNLGVQYTSASDALRLIANYRLSRDAVDFDFGIGALVPLDDYGVIDLSVAYAFNATFEVYGRILNAADEDYRETAPYNTAGREAYAGMRFKF